MELKNIKAEYYDYKKLRSFKIPYEQIHMLQNAVNLQDLENIIKAYPRYNWHRIKQQLEHGRKIVDRFNQSNKKIEAYKTNGYKNTKLEKMDSQNFIGHLMIVSPTNKHSAVWGKLLNKSIEIIKKELQLVDTNGQNYVLNNYNEFNHNHLSLLISSINMYEEQIERQYELIKRTSTNLLKENFLEKKHIAIDNYIDIIDYLIIGNPKDLFWGELTDTESKLYLDSTKKYGNKVKEKLVTYIAHYTTLPELEQLDNGNMKVLERFIK